MGIAGTNDQFIGLDQQAHYAGRSAFPDTQLLNCRNLRATLSGRAPRSEGAMKPYDYLVASFLVGLILWAIAALPRRK